MITGIGSGTGKYSYQECSIHNRSVVVSHMPEDRFSEIRIVFRHNGETDIPIIKLNPNEAKILWVALGNMAKDLKWSDKMENEIKE